MFSSDYLISRQAAHSTKTIAPDFIQKSTLIHEQFTYNSHSIHPENSPTILSQFSHNSPRFTHSYISPVYPLNPPRALCLTSIHSTPPSKIHTNTQKYKYPIFPLPSPSLSLYSSPKISLALVPSPPPTLPPPKGRAHTTHRRPSLR